MSDDHPIEYQVRLWTCPLCGEVNESPRSRCEGCGLIEEHECMICHKHIFVSADGRWHEGITGMYAYDWSDEYEDVEFAGYICFECANNLQKEGKGEILGNHGLAPDFWFEEADRSLDQHNQK